MYVQRSYRTSRVSVVLWLLLGSSSFQCVHSVVIAEALFQRLAEYQTSRRSRSAPFSAVVLHLRRVEKAGRQSFSLQQKRGSSLRRFSVQCVICSHIWANEKSNFSAHSEPIYAIEVLKPYLMVILSAHLCSIDLFDPMRFVANFSVRPPSTHASTFCSAARTFRSTTSTHSFPVETTSENWISNILRVRITHLRRPMWLDGGLGPRLTLRPWFPYFLRKYLANVGGWLWFLHVECAAVCASIRISVVLLLWVLFICKEAKMEEISQTIYRRRCAHFDLVIIKTVKTKWNQFWEDGSFCFPKKKKKRITNKIDLWSNYWCFKYLYV